MEEIAQVYARALFQVAVQRDELDVIREQLNQFAEVLEQDRNVAIFFFSPYFSSDEKKAAMTRAIDGAEPAFMNFLQALVERHRMPAIFRIRDRYEQLWDEAKRLLPVHVTSAIELDASTIAQIGDRVGQQTGNQIELTSTVDPDIIGGLVLRVGNFILDASIRNRLNQLRQQVAQG
jgi:F-type H+-transporting ATPase subunit delta